MSDVPEYEIMFSLLQAEKFANEVIGHALESPDVMDELAEDIAEHLSDFFEDYPGLSHLLNKEGFMDRVIQKLSSRNSGTSRWQAVNLRHIDQGKTNGENHG